jgi:glycine/D-amino acid oxidase-like deaminating enzyme
MNSLQPRNDYDVVIIGGGIIGLASAYYATARGQRTLLIDQYGIRNDINSSKGVERMFRLMQDNESEARMAETSLALWMELQLATGEPQLSMGELIFFGHRDAPMTTEGNVRQVKITMDRMGMPYEYLDSPDAIHRRFPIFNRDALPHDYVGLVQAASASINVQEATKSFFHVANQTGLLDVLDKHTVLEVDYHGTTQANHHYTLHTQGEKSSVRGKHLIACPGVWADSVLNPLGLRQTRKWKIWQMNYAYWQVKKPQPKIPIWFEFGNVDANDHRTFYGFPPLDFTPARNTVKMSADYTYDIFDAPSAIRPGVNERLMTELSQHLSLLLNTEVIDATHFDHAGTCLYSMSPDGKLVIGRIPTKPCSESFYLGASMCVMESGRAFKYAPLFGRVLVELALDGQSRYQSDLEVFSPIRGGLFEEI